jgi:hypothetical protein
MSMAKFNIGDRVAVYDQGDRRVGVIIGIYTYRGDSAVSIHVEFDSWTSDEFFPQQCRRLKRKTESRQWWVLCHADGTKPDSVWRDPAIATTYAHGRELVHVREVKKK